MGRSSGTAGIDSRPIRAAEPSDAGEICVIYNHYVEHTTITFEEEPVSREEMANRIREVGARYPWLVCVDGKMEGPKRVQDVRREHDLSQR